MSQDFNAMDNQRTPMLTRASSSSSSDASSGTSPVDPAEIRGQGHVGPWVFIIVAPTTEEALGVRKFLDQHGVVIAQGSHELTFTKGHLTDQKIEPISSSTGGERRYRNIVITISKLEYVSDQEELGQFLSKCRCPNPNDKPLYRRCLVFCERLTDGDFQSTKWIPWPQYAKHFSGLESDAPASEMSVLLSFTTDSVPCLHTTSLPTTPSSVSENSAEIPSIRREKRPKIAREASNGNLCFGGSSIKKLRLITVLNHLPSQEATAHWHQSFGRFVHESILTNESQVIKVIRTEFEQFMANAQDEAHLESVKLRDYTLIPNAPHAENCSIEYHEQLEKARTEKWEFKGEFPILLTYAEGFKDDVMEIKNWLKSQAQHNPNNQGRKLKVVVKDDKDVFMITNGEDLRKALSSKPFFWYHAGHGENSQLLDVYYNSFKDWLTEDHCRLVFLNMCHGLEAYQHLQHLVDNIIYWHGPVETNFAKDVGLRFIKEFHARFIEGDNDTRDPLFLCVRSAFNRVKEDDHLASMFGRYEPGGQYRGDWNIKLVPMTLPPLSSCTLRIRVGDDVRIYEAKASPSNNLSLTPASRERALIPLNATSYCFLHPLAILQDHLKTLEEKLKKDASVQKLPGHEDRISILMLLLRNGGFIYMEDRQGVTKNILAVNAISVDGKEVPGQFGILNTDGYQQVDRRLCDRLFLAQRFSAHWADAQPVSTERGKQVFRRLAWVRPNENVHEWSPRFANGAFVEVVFDRSTSASPSNFMFGRVLAVRRSG